MPKKVFTLNDFSGGLVTDKSTRALEDNELADCTNFNVSSKGKVIASRIFKDDDNIYGDHTCSAVVVGHGLFVFSNDFEVSDKTAYTGEFIVKTDGATLDVLEPQTAAATYTVDQAGTIATSPAFYAAEGDLFIGGVTSGTHTTPRSLVFHDQRPIPSANISLAYQAWQTTSQDKVVPDGSTAGKAIKLYQSTSAGTGTSTTQQADDILIWIIKPDANATGLWTQNVSEAEQKYEFKGTWLYKNNAESDMFTLAVAAGSLDLSEEAILVQAWYSQDVPITSATTDNGIYGARLYTRYSGDNGDYFLLAEMNFERGIKGDGETEWSPWEAQDDGGTNFDHSADDGDCCTTGLILAPPALLTYKILNGYSLGDIPDSNMDGSPDRIVGFKTGIIANSRAYIGNVSINNRVHGDRILKSPVFQYDVFTESDFLDVAPNDGDQITALAAYGDRLLEFKNNAVYVINVSKELEFLEDEQQGAGVVFQAAVTTTPFGVVWVNTNGCYLYDGEKISQLQLGKISASDWTTNITDDAMIGYDSQHQQIVVFWNGSSQYLSVASRIAFVDSNPDTITDSSSGFVTSGFTAGTRVSVTGTSNNNSTFTIDSVAAGTLTLSASDSLTAESASGSTFTLTGASNAYVFDAETGGWHLVNDMASSLANVTNMVQARDNRLLIGGGLATGEILFLADRAGTGTGFSLKTKVFDFGNPEGKKNLLEVAVVYKYGNAALSVKVITTADDGTVTTTTLGVIDQTDGEVTTKEFDTSSTAALRGNKTYQIEVSGTAHQSVEITSISLTYRDLGVH